MINKADILLNNEIKVTSPRSQWFGHTGRVNKVMADGRTLVVKLTPGCTKDVIFIDVTLVSQIQEPVKMAPLPQSLGPYGNHMVKDTI